jgi:hypothetical protein
MDRNDDGHRGGENVGILCPASRRLQGFHYNSYEITR